MITDLRDMMEERLLAYRTKNRELPQRILVYRDGVSEVCRRHFLRLLRLM
jgi:eukaryotic translation initiation factor 2C